MKEVSKMSLIVLVGSQRGKYTASGGRVQHMTGLKINKSLLALRECIRALSRDDGSHVPCRHSTLTKVLRNSFIGDKSEVFLPIDDDKENRCRHHLYHRDGSVSSNDSTSSSSNDLRVDDEQDEASSSLYAAQVEHLQDYEEALFDSCRDILINKEATLTKQLRKIVKQV
ncbi:unnamed protein product [Rotaria sp. Silwood1]|nr:unnamed protein product [Rotaria sp. Silwood1]CAF1653690.1 unnamed protein product [Rotaria sp. Silwood1]CAF3885511.1 unnamed protein product [Rotaria sp. Silwood1]CAF3885917.1 unnamed protein product [Rotaria sp. Silwood1]CAF5000990.1 unnamed protein product [Rotaria sp. Silwood1]